MFAHPPRSTPSEAPLAIPWEDPGARGTRFQPFFCRSRAKKPMKISRAALNAPRKALCFRLKRLFCVLKAPPRNPLGNARFQGVQTRRAYTAYRRKRPSGRRLPS